MVWQDVVLSFAELLLLLSIVPQVVLGFRQRRGYITYLTAFATAVPLFIIAIALFTLGLFLASFVALLNALLWLVFVIQRWLWGGP